MNNEKFDSLERELLNQEGSRGDVKFSLSRRRGSQNAEIKVYLLGDYWGTFRVVNEQETIDIEMSHLHKHCTVVDLYYITEALMDTVMNVTKVLRGKNK